MKRILGSLSLSGLCVSSACFLLASAAVPAHADSIAAFSFASATFATIDPDTAELGYDFTTGSDPTLVSALGYVNDGFNGTHTVEIFNVATRQSVAGAFATVTTVGGGPTSNTFTYTDLASPVTLAANTQYQIVSQFFRNEYYFYNATGFTSQAGITLDIAVFDDYGDPPALPAFATGSYAPTVPGDFGPNFKITTPAITSPVPEMPSIYLLTSGLASIGITTFRRR